MIHLLSHHLLRIILGLGILVSFLTSAHPLPNNFHAAWFRSTPLQSSYQKLVEGFPQQAWHELISALSFTPVAEPFWQPIKEEILNQTQCGQSLQATSTNDKAVAVTFIHKINQTFQGYQVKVSIDDLVEPLNVSLISPQGKMIIEQTLVPAIYTESESHELLSPYASGVYWLILGKQRFPLLISAPSIVAWIDPINDNKININLPITLYICAPALAREQFFDQNFALLHSQIINSSKPFTFAKATKETKWKSLSVIKSEYQGSIRVEYIQRLTSPIR